MSTNWTKPTRRLREFRFSGGLTPSVLAWACNRFADERHTRPRRCHLHPRALESYFGDPQTQTMMFRRYRVTKYQRYRWWERLANAMLGLTGRPSLKQKILEAVPLHSGMDLIVDHDTDPDVFRLG